MTIVGYFVLD